MLKVITLIMDLVLIYTTKGATIIGSDPLKVTVLQFIFILKSGCHGAIDP